MSRRKVVDTLTRRRGSSSGAVLRAGRGDVWYTKDGKNWREFEAETVFAPRHEVTSYVFNDSLWAVDGNTWPVVDDVWWLTLAAN